MPKRSKKVKSDDKKFRINAKKLFLTYPKQCPKTGIRLDKVIIFSALGIKLEKYELESLMVGEEVSEDNYAFVNLEKKVNITKEDVLDIKGAHDNYQAAKKEYDSVKYVIKDTK